jgi:hypothetical protein
MKRKLFLTAALLMVAGFAFAKENLAILPFTGGQGNEGETIAELFSFVPRLGEVFGIIPRTSISRAISNERGFQMDSGMTDTRTIVSIANEAGARYVVAGSITSVGNNNLLVISILDIRNLQQIAGDFQTYPRGRIEDLRKRLPSMAENIIRATLNNTAALPKLAIVPVQLEGGTDWRVADTLAQILAIHLIRSGKYAVFPRTESLEQVQAEHDAQMSGHTADRNIIGKGYGENPDYVLSVVARRLGSVNMFNAVIINLLTRIQDVGRPVDYQDINDGMRAMEELSAVLTSTTEQIAQRQQEEEERKREEEKQRLKDKRKANFIDDFRKNSGLALGVCTGLSFDFFNDLSSDWKVDPDRSSPSFSFSILAELKLGSYFSIQTEANFNLFNPWFREAYDYHVYEKYGPNEYIDYNYFGTIEIPNNYIQIPLLVKVNLSAGNFVFSPLAGIGFNIPITMGGAAQKDETVYISYPYYNHSTKDYDYSESYVEISMPPSIIAGFDAGFKLGRSGITVLFADVRYIHGLGKTERKELDLSYTQSSLNISLGIKFIIPFARQ